LIVNEDIGQLELFDHPGAAFLAQGVHVNGLDAYAS